MCILNLNALNYRPPKRNEVYCGAHSYRPLSSSNNLDSSLFFWPLIPPFLLPWLHWPPLPFAFPPLPFPFNLIPVPDPLSLPFSIPPWLLPFLDPASLPFPFSLFPPSTPSPPPFPPNRSWPQLRLIWRFQEYYCVQVRWSLCDFLPELETVLHFHNFCCFKCFLLAIIIHGNLSDIKENASWLWFSHINNETYGWSIFFFFLLKYGWIR